jgi:hypothetical protein
MLKLFSYLHIRLSNDQDKCSLYNNLRLSCVVLYFAGAQREGHVSEKFGKKEIKFRIKLVMML